MAAPTPAPRSAPSAGSPAEACSDKRGRCQGRRHGGNHQGFLQHVDLQRFVALTAGAGGSRPAGGKFRLSRPLTSGGAKRTRNLTNCYMFVGRRAAPEIGSKSRRLGTKPRASDQSRRAVRIPEFGDFARLTIQSRPEPGGFPRGIVREHRQDRRASCGCRPRPMGGGPYDASGNAARAGCAMLAGARGPAAFWPPASP